MLELLEPLRFWSGGRGGGEVPQKGKKAKNDYSAIADIFQYILVESLRNVKLGFKNRNLLFFNCQNTKAPNNTKLIQQKSTLFFLLIFDF